MQTRQIYYSHHIFRCLLRNSENNKQEELIKKNKNSRIAVVLHLFYSKSWKEIKEYLTNLSSYKYDLIVTTTNEMISSEVMRQIKAFKSDVKIIECENKGFDLRPFLLALKSIDLDNYDIVFKLQSKSTKRAYIYIYEQLFLRRDWFLDLFEGVLSSKVIHQNIDKLLNDDSVGLIAAANLIVHDPWHKARIVKNIADNRGLNIPDDYKFVAGTCFAIKAQCLKNIQAYPWTEEDFMPVLNSRGMSFAHFFERYICTQVESVWNKKLEGASIRPVRHAILSVPNKILYRYSSNRLFDENITFDPEYFYWQLDNKFLKWTYEEVPFSKLNYANGVVKIPFIENAPYKYLLGNKKGYEEYCIEHEKQGLPAMSAERFDKLRNSIEEEGYDKRHIVIVDSNYNLMDGQHRAACLCYKLGEDASIEVLKIRFIGFKETVKKIIPRVLLEKLKKIKNGN